MIQYIHSIIPIQFKYLISIFHIHLLLFFTVPNIYHKYSFSISIFFQKFKGAKIFNQLKMILILTFFREFSLSLFSYLLFPNSFPIFFSLYHFLHMKVQFKKF